MEQRLLPGEIRAENEKKYIALSFVKTEKHGSMTWIFEICFSSLICVALKNRINHTSQQ